MGANKNAIDHKMQPVMGSVDGAASQPDATSDRAALQADAMKDGAAAPQPDVTSDGAALHLDTNFVVVTSGDN